MLHVFCYHRVVEQLVGYDRWGLAVSKPRFEQQIENLSRRMSLLNLSRLTLREAWESTEDYALITFDDVYYEVLTCALPVLNAFGASALLFIAGSFLGKKSFWWDDLEACFTNRLADQRNAAIDNAWHWLRDRPLEEKVMVLKHMARLRPVAAFPAGCRPLSHQELKDAAEHPSVWFGGHTMSHPWMPVLDIDTMVAEIDDGTQLLRHVTGREPVAFAYPFGAWNKEARQAVAKSGYSFAFTTARPSYYPSDNRNLDPLAFPRLEVNRWSSSDLIPRPN